MYLNVVKEKISSENKKPQEKLGLSSNRKSLNEIIVNGVHNKGKFTAKKPKRNSSKSNHGVTNTFQRLKNVQNKTKLVLEKYRERERLLVKENNKLKGQVKDLIKILAAHEIII